MKRLRPTQFNHYYFIAGDDLTDSWDERIQARIDHPEGAAEIEDPR
ncbi:MAG: hypothetical protein MZU91_06815 [Desulfosudis oleivorans]|nr:hypothetical protein [Desulfosudis oleivorans]